MDSMLTVIIITALIHLLMCLRESLSISPLGAEVICSRMRGLTDRQRDMCRTSPDGFVAVAAGVRLGLQECQLQFSHHRWNCTDIGWPHVFTHVVVVGSKEAAFTYAIASAGATYAVTAACSKGNISSCGCDPEHQNRRDVAPRGWKWGGCSADVGYGMRFSRKFLDARELEGDARSAMNLHNNKAGRKAVRSNLQVECKCHGVSGSCTMRTCWKTLPPFRKIGDTLLKKYMRARSVMAVGGGGIYTQSSLPTNSLKLVLRRPRSFGNPDQTAVIPKRSDLVFLQNSPNYCERNSQKGSLGTAGRNCNRTSKENDGCDILCCGRGYNTHQVVRVWQCHCKFIWCCSVHCDTCTENVEEHTCK